MSTLRTLQDVLVAGYRLQPEQVTPDADLATLGLDSLGMLELMFKIEDAFGFKISEDMPPDLRTVGEVVRYIDGVIAAKAASAAAPVRVSA